MSHDNLVQSDTELMRLRRIPGIELHYHDSPLLSFITDTVSARAVLQALKHKYPNLIRVTLPFPIWNDLTPNGCRVGDYIGIQIW